MKKYLAILLLLATLVVALFIVGCRNQQTTSTQASTASEKITLAQDEAACPVLGTVMKKADMIPMEYKGKMYYLCCPGCKPQFKADPEKYINNPAPFTRTMPR